MRPLIDCDVLLYEIGFSSEKIETDENGEKVVVPSTWDFCQDLFDKKIALICDEVQATGPPLLFITNTHKVNKTLNKQRERQGEEPKEYVENFRIEAAKEKEYKGGRKTTKPFHFTNLLHYVLASYDVHVNETGLEADDAMVIMQYSAYKNGELNTIICSRDKDVRQCPGWHYSWECGGQASIGPIMVDELGELIHRNPGEKDSKGRAKPAKIFGTGAKFLYYQMLVGDAVDNIGGMKGRGPVFAYTLLKDAESVRQAYELTAEVYVKAWGDDWKPKFREQVDLLYMIKEVDGQGEKIKWRPPK